MSSIPASEARKLARIARALVEYTRHKPRCGQGRLPWRCTCGLEDLVRPLRPLDADDGDEEPA